MSRFSRAKKFSKFTSAGNRLVQSFLISAFEFIGSINIQDIIV